MSWAYSTRYFLAVLFEIPVSSISQHSSCFLFYFLMAGGGGAERERERMCDFAFQINKFFKQTRRCLHPLAESLVLSLTLTPDSSFRPIQQEGLGRIQVTGFLSLCGRSGIESLGQAPLLQSSGECASRGRAPSLPFKIKTEGGPH